MVSGFLTSPWDQSRIFCGAASLIRIASNVMGFACRSRMPHRSLVGLSSLIRLPKGRSVSIHTLLCSEGREAGSYRGWPALEARGTDTPVQPFDTRSVVPHPSLDFVVGFSLTTPSFRLS